jgi:hypothetical protein
MRWFLISSVVLAQAGCSHTQAFEVSVGEEEDGTPTFSWDVGNVHEVQVLKCNGACECDKDGHLDGEGLIVWHLGFSDDAVPGEAADTPPDIESPVLYGDPDVPGDDRHEEALPLEVGAKYGVDVRVQQPCEPPETGCMQLAGQGCSTFVYEE